MECSEKNRLFNANFAFPIYLPKMLKNGGKQGSIGLSGDIVM